MSAPVHAPSAALAAWSRVPRPVRVVVGEVLLVAATVTAVLLAVPTSELALPTAVAACLLLPVRLKWPWLSMLVCLVALGCTLGLAPSVVALYRIGRRGSGRAAAAWVVAAVLAVEIPVLITSTTPLAGNVLGVVFSVLCATGPAALGALVTTRGRLTESLAALRDAREAELAAREEQARARERARVGQEIHDAVGHHAMLLAVEAAATATTTENPETRRFAGRVRELAKESLTEMRAALGLLGAARDSTARAAAPETTRRDGAVLDGSGESPAPGLADVPALVRRAERSGVDVVLADETGGGDGLAPVAGRAVFRIVQESLTNAAKHAPGAPVTVRLARDGADFLVTITTPAGAPATAAVGSAAGSAGSGGAEGPDSGGQGLTGLAERTRTAGGVLEVDRSDGRFSVRARLPLGGTLRK